MKISYNWLKSYIPDVPEVEKLSDIFTFHICEVESLEKLLDGDVVFDIKILPNRAHDLLSHRGIAHELASLLDIKFIDPTPKYKVPESKSTNLKIDIESDKCRRYMGRILRGVKIGPSPEWAVAHLESIGQRSINNMVDAANIVMYDCGQPTHVFDLNKIQEKLIVRFAKDGEELTTLDNKNCKLTSSNLVIADAKNVLAIAGVKGGKIAEVDNDTKDIILEVANFDPTSVRKTAQMLNIFTDAKKRFENDLSPELGSYAMLEFSALILEMCPEASFEDVVDIYPQKAKQKKVSVSVNYINKRLGSNFSKEEIESVWKKLNFEYTEKNGEYEITVPFLRIDITGPYDLTEDVISILGYDRLEEKLPEIKLESKINETFAKMLLARSKLLNEGYSEVMTYVFRDKGEVGVLASASDKKFLRTNLTDGLKESLKLNQINMPLLGMKEIKIFEIGTIFKKSGEEMHVAYADKKEIKETTLSQFVSGESFSDFKLESRNHNLEAKFKMWSLFPFIARDIAVWVPENIESEEVEKIIKENAGDVVVRGPELFDEFKKEGQISYAFRLVFQSFERTLTDEEINSVMTKITNKIKENNGWQVR
ncbi:MAG: Phenylalanine-tRNA ligase beta subunit [Parcubacteria group bacterium GW2011_GWB1_35_5]|nr:MAG: Phenylalanine-tRNA ligase beta subunit [Parcubacteria group bacterium GW2011_GWB1_35_5]